MQKFLCLVFAAALACSTLTGCIGEKSDSAKNPAADESTVSAASEESAAASSKGLTADQIAEGTYDISVDTDSSMVNVVYCRLTVEDGAMTATMALHGEGFSRIYFGDADDASNATDDEVFSYVEDADGWYTFTFPLDYLDKDTECALFGHRRDRWYNHVLVFESTGIPSESIQE